jgi:hypothetical protein
VPESSEAAAAALIEGVADAPSSRYVDFPSIRIIDLDATELPSNDWEILEVAMERMFADLSILDAIASVPPVPRQDEGAGGSVPPTVLEAAKGDSVVIEPPPISAGESTNAPLLQPAEAGMDTPTPSVVGVVEGVVEGVGPSSSQPAAATAEEVPVLSQPTAAPQECDAPEGTTRAASPQERDAPGGTTTTASPEIQEVVENSGATLPRGIRSGEAQALELACVPWAAAFKVGDDTEDDEKAEACNTLERGLAWARRAFDELILPATSVSFPHVSSLSIGKTCMKFRSASVRISYALLHLREIPRFLSTQGARGLLASNLTLI